MDITSGNVWSLILAGGDGTRLGTLTRQITGEARPKQFCALLDGETLLDRTRRRVDLLSRFDRQTVVVTQHHEPFYAPLVTELAPGRLVVQPANRGTGPGLLYPILRVAELAGDAPMAVFPSDHFVDDDAAFIGGVSAALDVVQHRPGLVALLGIEPSAPETEYGWIEFDGRPLPVEGEPVFPIRRFWEKPPAHVASRLMGLGCLWNSFVMVGRVTAFLDLFRATVPGLLRAFEPIRRTVGSAREADAAERVYRRLRAVNFSDRVLTPATGRLGVARLKGVRWSDLGSVERLLATIRGLGRRPRWLDEVPLPAAG
ncbi:MAG TPA: sugar phosphate nucleotidyltransferase [Methylomirabilota bacterium]|nr:sugar phosphate nucleotidyltransferase [Methylomirabilota bacterium]